MRWVYHPQHAAKIVTVEQAEEMYGKGWYDTPAKFPVEEVEKPKRGRRKKED